MALQLAPLEPLQRALGLPAFLSRESVRVGSVDLNYRATRAQHDLGWTHPDPAAMWERTIATERRLIAARTGVLAKLRPDPVCPELC